MKLLDYFIIAFRNLSRRKLRSFLTIIAVVIGSISVIVMISLVIGARNVFMQQLESMGALTMVTVSRSDEVTSGGPNLQLGGGDSNSLNGTKLDDAIVEKVKAIPHVTGVSPSVSLWDFETINLPGDTKKYRPDIIAIEPNGTLRLDTMAGRTLQPNDMRKILLGAGLAKKFGYKDNPEQLVGKKVILSAKGWYSGDGVEIEKPPANGGEDWYKAQENTVREIEVEIIGVVSAGMNDSQSYVSLNWARLVQTQRNWKYDDAKSKELEQQRRIEDEQLQQQEKRGGTRIDWEKRQREWEAQMADLMILQTSDQIKERGYGSILANVDDMNNVEAVAKQVEALGVGASTAKDFLDSLSQLLKVAGLILGAIGGVSLGVAAIGIINTMVMATYERTKEIGVMRACGATKATVRQLFTFEAALLGFWGGVIGLAISFGLAILGNYFGNQYLTNQNISLSNIITFPWWLILGVVGFTTFIGTLAGLYPASRASRLNPVEALRYE